MTKSPTNIFSLALFVPQPVTEDMVATWGPVVEVDRKFAKKAAKMNALFASNDLEKIRKSDFYTRYALQMIKCITFIRTRMPSDWSARVYISPELEPIAADILQSGNVEVAIMAAPSIRTAGAFWRWLSFDDVNLDIAIACDSDELDGTFGGTVLATLWSGVTKWRESGPQRGHAILRWFVGWTQRTRSLNSHLIQYSPIQANVIMSKPKLLTWSIVDSIIGFSLARIARPWERRFHPHGHTRVHAFSRILDRTPIPTSSGTVDGGPYYPNLGWGRRYQEYGYDEAWTKHVLYYRSLAEGSLFSAIPLRNMESEIATDLLYSGLKRSDANAALRCSNAWFLDGVEISRYPGNAVAATNGFGPCDAHSTGQPAHVEPCGKKPGNIQTWVLSSEGCFRANIVGQEESTCLTVPTQNRRDALRLERIHVPIQHYWCEQVCGSDPNAERVAMRVRRQFFEFTQIGESKEVGMFEVKYPYKIKNGTLESSDSKECLAINKRHGMVVMLPCNSSDATQIWNFNVATNTVTIRSGKSNEPQCLTMKHCGALVLDVSPLATSCNSSSFDAQIMANKSVPPLQEIATPPSLSAGISSLLPQPGSKDQSMLESLQKAEAVLRWWLVEYRVRSHEEVTKMTLSDIRSTFLAEVTDGSHRGYLRAWTVDVNEYSPQFPIQGIVAMLPVLEDARAATLRMLLGVLRGHNYINEAQIHEVRENKNVVDAMARALTMTIDLLLENLDADDFEEAQTAAEARESKLHELQACTSSDLIFRLLEMARIAKASIPWADKIDPALYPEKYLTKNDTVLTVKEILAMTTDRLNYLLES
jgi:hypothetical protein